MAKLDWQKQPDLINGSGNYTPFFIQENGSFEIFANTDGRTIGAWFRRTGLPPKMGPAALVLDPGEITDQPGAPLIRTSAVAQGRSGRIYAILHVGHGYPSQTGYVPAFATSSNGTSWNYGGKLKIDGEVVYAYASGANLIVQEQFGPVPDHETPSNNRFLLWNDAYAIDNKPKRLVLIYSADGEQWFFYRNALGEVADVFPSSLSNDKPVFPAACRTPFGYHLIAGDRYPCTSHRHLFSKDAVNWQILEHHCPTYAHHKGTNLAFEQKSGQIHAITASIHHWTLAAQNFEQ